METEPLAKACELAFAVARQGVEANPPIEPPAPMRSFLYVPQLPRRAMSVAQRVIEEDPTFRARVAAQATESSVGEVGYRWLHRPNGWDADQPVSFSNSLPDLPSHAGNVVPAPQPARPVTPPPAPPVRLAEPASDAMPSGAVPPPPPPPVRSVVAAAEEPRLSVDRAVDANVSIGEELASLRGLVARLAAERQPADAQVQSSGSVLGAAVVSPADGARAFSTSPLGSQPTELDQARQDRDRARTEREHLLTHQGELEIELAELRLAAERAKQEAARARADADQTRVDLDQARADADAARVETDEAVAAEANLRSQIDAAVAERDAAWTEAGSIRIERDQLQDRVRVAEQARVELEAQLDDLSGQWQELKVENQNLAAERDDARRAFDELSATSGAAAVERRALFNELATQLGQVEAERDHLASEIERTRDQLSGTRTALDTANQAVRGELDSAEAAASSSIEAIGRLDATLEGAHERLADLDHVVGVPASTGLTNAASDVTAVPTPPVAPAPPALPATPSQPADPGTVSGEVDIDAFLPEGVEIGLDHPEIEDPAAGSPEAGNPEVERGATTEADATLFGNPRDVPDRALFSERVTEARTSADDDQALANVMATYGFGADEDARDSGDLGLGASSVGASGVGDSDSSIDDEPITFDLNDTSSFIDPDHTTAHDPSIQEPSTQEPSTQEPSTQEPSTQEEPSTALDVTHARRVAMTPDMVMLVDGDAAASMGWRESTVADRRRYLLEKLDQVTGEYGPALDVVFDAAVGGEEHLPPPTKVRRRLIQAGSGVEEKLSELVDRYPSHFPIAVVSDQAGLRDQLRLRSVETLEVVELLDLIIGLPEHG